MPAVRWLLCAAVLLATAPVAHAAEFEVRDGQDWVLNPETPRDGSVDLEAGFLWQRGDDMDDVFFGVVPRIMVDDSGEIYVLDSQLHEILVFDNGGEWLRTIGREGEGPGEFRNPGDMFHSPDGDIGVMQVFPGRIVRLTPQGEPGAAFDPGQFEGFQVFYLSAGVGDRVVISGSTFGGNANGGSQTNYLRAFDVDGNQVAEYFAETSPIQFGGMTFREPEFTNFTRRWAAAPDGRVAVGQSFGDYRIHVYDADGDLLHVIDRPDYQPVERTKQEKARFQRLYDGITAWNQGSTFEVSDTHQAISQMSFRDDGTLWVMSGAGQWRAEEGVMGVWDVYGVDGEYLREVRMLGDGDPVEDGYFFAGDRMYQVTDLFSAAMSQLGGDEDDAEVMDPEPVRLVAWKLESSVASQ
jgi:hypothetical protein